ncbi:MAG TPA: nucleotidyl transferase AbiEii/AbiGii toxin family protein [Actinospica sp.]|nr:nucleotidyl transferase AbiEii/AbiGii toxin family protein [Actinospica sp.]
MDRVDRTEALDLALAAVAASGRADDLMLRGSALMSTWYPTQAREPGDLDFVVLAEDWEIDDPATDEFFAELMSAPGFGSGLARIESIWEYDRAPGRRLTMPFPGGSVQLDFVFGEKVSIEPETAVIALSRSGPGVRLRVAPKPISLAWKLSWLLVDFEPKPKDLYDAVLLAEDDSIDRRVLRTTLLEVFEQLGADRLADLGDIDVEFSWSEFQREHPQATGSGDDWLRRLEIALKAP